MASAVLYLNSANLSKLKYTLNWESTSVYQHTSISLTLIKLKKQTDNRFHNPLVPNIRHCKLNPIINRITLIIKNCIWSFITIFNDDFWLLRQLIDNQPIVIDWTSKVQISKYLLVSWGWLQIFHNLFFGHFTDYIDVVD